MYYVPKYVLQIVCLYKYTCAAVCITWNLATLEWLVAYCLQSKHVAIQYGKIHIAK